MEVVKVSEEEKRGKREEEAEADSQYSLGERSETRENEEAELREMVDRGVEWSRMANTYVLDRRSPKI